MCRAAFSSLLVVAVAAAECAACEGPGSRAPPLTYELMINGESFFVEADRQVKLHSRDHPGVTYDVALRIALEQRVRLNTLQFRYDWPAEVEDDRDGPHRAVRIRHELGFTLLVTDVGGPLDSPSQDKVLDILRQSTLESFQGAGMEQIAMAELAQRKFAGSAGRGVKIQYRDRQGDGRTCLVYLLTGPTFAGYCIAEYRDADEADVLPRIRRTLDSIRAAR